jgi:hypothetical protein
MIVGSLLLILVAVTMLVMGLAAGSSGLLIGSIAASLLAAVALVVGARQAAATRAQRGEPFRSPLGDDRSGDGWPSVAVADPDTDRAADVSARSADTEVLHPDQHASPFEARAPFATDPYVHHDDADRDDIHGDSAHGDDVHRDDLSADDAADLTSDDGSRDLPDPAQAGRDDVLAEMAGRPFAADPRHDDVPHDGLRHDDLHFDDLHLNDPRRDDLHVDDLRAEPLMPGPLMPGPLMPGPLMSGAPAVAEADPIDAVPPAGHPGDLGPVRGDLAGSATADPVTVDEFDEDPADEPLPQRVQPTDAVRVSRMTVDVLVVDGRPRYHLTGCPHLDGRESEPIPVGEAVDLGFTPCGLCRPVDALVSESSRR